MLQGGGAVRACVRRQMLAAPPGNHLLRAHHERYTHVCVCLLFQNKAYERMTSWTQHELSSGGYTVQGLVGARVGRLFREHVVRFSLPPRRKDNRVRFD